jgi:hypothetical protein
MRSKYYLYLIILFFFGCSKSEKLTEDEQRYVALTISLAKARAQATDSLSLWRKLDSVYKKHESSENDYKSTTTSLSEIPGRADIIFRAINDSLSKVK